MLCPVCGKTKSDYGELKNTRQHILAAARREALNVYLRIDTYKEHLDYVKENICVSEIRKFNYKI